jgi:stage III sporulation protein AB
MMIKMLGLVLIVASCSAMGLRMHGALRRRSRALASFIPALQTIKAEIVFRAMPLPDILDALTRENNGAAGVFFGKVARRMAVSEEGFAPACAALLPTLEGAGLRPGDVRQVQAALAGLGRYDAATQAEGLTAAIRALEEALSGARAELNQKGRLYRAMGVTVGIMIALIII